MAASVITTQIQNVEINAVTDIVVTPTAQDTAVGDYVRDIGIFGTAADGSADVLVLQVRIRSALSANLDIIAPEQPF
jgi:hypothetical protein